MSFVKSPAYFLFEIVYKSFFLDVPRLWILWILLKKLVFGPQLFAVFHV